jgi:hypothetical protein
MAHQNPSWIANGTIEVCRFVKIDTTSGKFLNVVQADANASQIIGISQEGARDTPGLTGAADDAARAGQTLEVHGLGEVCLLELGGSVTAGDYLEPDANGKGVAMNLAAATNRNYGAKALMTGSSGEKIWVQVLIGTARPA